MCLHCEDYSGQGKRKPFARGVGACVHLVNSEEEPACGSVAEEIERRGRGTTDDHVIVYRRARWCRGVAEKVIFALHHGIWGGEWRMKLHCGGRTRAWEEEGELGACSLLMSCRLCAVLDVALAAEREVRRANIGPL